MSSASSLVMELSWAAREIRMRRDANWATISLVAGRTWNPSSQWLMGFLTKYPSQCSQMYSRILGSPVSLNSSMTRSSGFLLPEPVSDCSWAHL